MPHLPRPLPSDLGLAGLLAAWWLSETGGGGPVALAGLALCTAPLGWRRSAPLSAALAVAAGFVVTSLPAAPAEPLAQLVAVLVAPWSVAVHARSAGLARAGGAAAVASAAVSGTLVADGDVLFSVLLVAAAWAAGTATRRLHARSAALAAEAAALAERADRAAAQERERLARELHDVVAHAVSLMAVQAAAARHVLRTDPAQAERALDAVHAAGRDAIDDLRRMLGLLRGGAEDDGRSPAPGLAALDALIAAQDETIEVRRDPLPPLPPAVDLAAYRVVQEGLTNARKHAPGRPTSVRIGWSTGRLRLEVRTAGVPTGHADPPDAGGLGLVGLRERVAVFGGDLRVGPEAGDWVVRASLPVAAG